MGLYYNNYLAFYLFVKDDAHNKIEIQTTRDNLMKEVRPDPFVCLLLSKMIFITFLILY